MTDYAGQDIGRYHIIEQLGQGGMATVFRAYDTRLEREVAIKFIRREEVGAAYLEQLLKRFEREAKSLAQLSHPNIVKVYDYGDHEGVPYLVMEHMPGGTLKQRLGKRLPPVEAARLLAPIARALAYAHQEHLIHRDVKPANILITRSGEPMLTDFGIAKILEGASGSTALTGTGVGMGTPDYMAPEQWTNQVTPQTDVYALGVVFFEMVTGRRPFAADTPAAVLIKQMQDPLPRPKELVPELPDAVEQALFKALAKEPGERYATMAAFAEALEDVVRTGGAQMVRSAASPNPAQPPPHSARGPAAPSHTVTARKPLPPPPTELISPAAPRSGPQASAMPPSQPASATGRGPWLWALGGAGAVGLLVMVGVVVLGVLFAAANFGKLTGTPVPTRSNPLSTSIAVAAAPPLAATSVPAATEAPGDLTAPPVGTAAPAQTVYAEVVMPTETRAPGGPATAAPIATSTAAPPPPSVSFRFCDQPCSQAGAKTLTTFPATTQIYFALNFTGMTPGDTWSRAWANQGQVWATYQGCSWKASEGTVENKLWDNGGLRSGTWTLTVTAQGQTYGGAFTVGGSSTYWSPVGTAQCPD